VTDLPSPSRATGVRLLALALALAVILFAEAAAEPRRVAVATLAYGTVAWEVAVVERHDLDGVRGLAIENRPVATNEASRLALLGGGADMILTDWLWVQQERAAGEDIVFVPATRATGALVVPPGSDISGLADLPGKRIGVAGGPLDKSWLLLRALGRRDLGQDLADAAEPVFAAPPLLESELQQGRIDAVLTYWHYAVRLEAGGDRAVLTVGDVVRALGAADVPMLGFAFRRAWAEEDPDRAADTLAAFAEARGILSTSSAEWAAIAPLVGTSDPALLAAIAQAYAAGGAVPWSAGTEAAARRVFDILHEVGGAALTGDAAELDPAGFWSHGG
jgi:NitT/TauT family transport system substrate-binding protein